MPTRRAHVASLNRYVELHFRRPPYLVTDREKECEGGHERILVILEGITVNLIIYAVIMFALGLGIKAEAAASIISAVAGYVFGRAGRARVSKPASGGASAVDRRGYSDRKTVGKDSQMTTPFEIGQAGEIIVVQWLREAGYTIKRWDTQSPGSADIEAASSNGRILLVQVKSAMYPNEPPFLSSDEEKNIESRATRIGAETWEARVQLNVSSQLIGSIQWRKAS